MNKLIIRADDLGLCDGVNRGIKRAIDTRLVRSTALMVNMEAAVNGYNMVKEDDIAIGLHTNLCLGKPILPPHLIPSLVDGKNFCSSKEIRSRMEDTIIVEEAEKEIEAQLLRFKEITGKNPDYFECHAIRSANFFEALKRVARKYNLFYENVVFDSDYELRTNIIGIPMPDDHEISKEGHYDFFKNIDDHFDIIEKADVAVLILHPGIVDDFLLSHSSYNYIRAFELSILESGEVEKYLLKHDLELTDFREYNHIR